jgi:hypothetical protein
MRQLSIAVILMVVTSLVTAQPAGVDAGQGVNFGEGMPPVAEQQAAPDTASEAPEATPATTTPAESQEQTIIIGGERVKAVDGYVVDERYAPAATRRAVRAAQAAHRHATRPEKWYRDIERYRGGKTKDQSVQWSAISTAQAAANKAQKTADVAKTTADNALVAAGAAYNLAQRWWIGLLGLAGLLGLLGLRGRRAAAEPAPAEPAAPEAAPAAAPDAEPEPAAAAPPAAAPAAAPAEQDRHIGDPPPPPDVV